MNKKHQSDSAFIEDESGEWTVTITSGASEAILAAMAAQAGEDKLEDYGGGIYSTPKMTLAEKLSDPDYLLNLLNVYYQEMENACVRIRRSKSPDKIVRRVARINYLLFHCAPFIILSLKRRYPGADIDSSLVERFSRIWNEVPFAAKVIWAREETKKIWQQRKIWAHVIRRCHYCHNIWRHSSPLRDAKSNPPDYPYDYEGNCLICQGELSEPMVPF